MRGGGGRGNPAPLHPFILQNCVLSYRPSEKVSQAKTSLKLDNSCFEDVLRSIFSYACHKAVRRPFCEVFFILVKCPRDSRKKFDWFRSKKISQKSKYLNFKCEQSNGYFFVLHSVHETLSHCLEFLTANKGLQLRNYRTAYLWNRKL